MRRTTLYLAVIIIISILFACTEETHVTLVSPVIDHIAPFVEWVDPESGSELSGTVELVFSVYDENSIDRIRVYINGVRYDGWGGHPCPPLTTQAETPAPPIQLGGIASSDTTFTLPWNTIDVEDGIYILEARAWDEAGNLGTSPSLMVNVKNETDPPPEDRLPPDVWWTAPDGGSTLSGTVNLQVRFYDESSVDSVRLLKNGAAVATYIPPYDSRGGEFEAEYLWNTLPDSDGVYIWEARAWDASGNVGVSPSLLIRVRNEEEPPPLDLTPPVVTWLSPEPGSTVEGLVELRFQVMDDVGLDSVKVYLNGQEWQNLVNVEEFLDANIIWITSDYPDGNYIVEVRAWDSSGNTGSAPGVTLLVLNHPPREPRVLWVPDDYEKIQDAIWASEDGDTIMVRAGEYHEQLQFFDKNVSLISELGPELTTIDGTGFYTAIWITGGQDTNMVVRGFKFINDSEFQCMCLNIYGGASPKIFNNIMIAPNGSGFWSGKTTALIRNNLFLNTDYAVSMAHSWGDFSNNMIIHTYNLAFWNAAINGQPLIPDYNLLWDFDRLLAGGPMVWGEHNIDDQEPLFEEGSYRLREGSPGIDQGRPDLLDPDGSRSDIGVYGGPYAY